MIGKNEASQDKCKAQNVKFLVVQGQNFLAVW